MTEYEADVVFEDEEEMEAWLDQVAATCISHMKYMELPHEPEELGPDDFGLLNLETAFMTLYALRTKGALPKDKEKMN